MASDPVTGNKSLLLISNGSASGTWGTVLNASVFSIVDQAFGNTVSVTVSSSDVNLTTSQAQNLAFKFTGTLTGAINVTLPLNPNSSSAAVGGYFIAENDSTGAFGLTVKTVATGSLGVTVPQGARAVLYSDGTNVSYGDDTQNQRAVYAGNPNGNVAGNAASASTRASLVINSQTNETYLATTSGTASSTVWHKNLPYPFPSEGYLTLSSDATNPVLTADAIAQTTLYYTAFRGDQMWVNNGTSFVPVTIPGGQISIPLSATFNTANDIFDAIGFLSTTGVVRAGLSPAWQTPTAGSGARGTGAGTPQLTRLNGVLVNAVSQTVNNGSNQFTVAANRGVYLGSIAIDGTAGQVTCHVSYGQNRKWGVSNAYYREPILLQAGDNTTSWSGPGSSTIRPSNNTSANALVTLCGLPEETIFVEYQQEGQSGSSSDFQVGIGVNSTSAFTGATGFASNNTNGGAMTLPAKASIAPGIGINRITSLESQGGTYFGKNAKMLLAARWNG